MDYSYTKKERTGWRDEKISRRHRLWGFNCPAIDIDFIMIEYNKGIPVALIEYKRYTGSISNVHQNSVNAIIILADNSNIPFFIVYYWDDVWAFQIFPVNNIAKEKLKNSKFVKSEIIPEQEYVSFLYELRGINLNKQEEQIIKSLNNRLPSSINKKRNL